VRQANAMAPRRSFDDIVRAIRQCERSVDSEPAELCGRIADRLSDVEGAQNSCAVGRGWSMSLVKTMPKTGRHSCPDGTVVGGVGALPPYEPHR
jgi:hypothetical protein